MTKNPIWLFQTKRDDHWYTKSVFASREAGRQFGTADSYQYGEEWKHWRVYAVCCHDEKLCQAIAAIRPDLVDEWSVGAKEKPLPAGESEEGRNDSPAPTR
jgi:hypothetical protein